MNTNNAAVQKKLVLIASRIEKFYDTDDDDRVMELIRHYVAVGLKHEGFDFDKNDIIKKNKSVYEIMMDEKMSTIWEYPTIDPSVFTTTATYTNEQQT